MCQCVSVSEARTQCPWMQWWVHKNMKFVQENAAMPLTAELCVCSRVAVSVIKPAPGHVRASFIGEVHIYSCPA